MSKPPTREFLEYEYDRVKSDPLKLQLYTVKYQKYLNQIVQEVKNDTPQRNDNNTISNIKSIETPEQNSKSIESPEQNGKSINRMKPLSKILSRDFKLPISGKLGCPDCLTKTIIFSTTAPLYWMYDYALKRISINLTNNVSRFSLELASVPVEHIHISGRMNKIELYVFENIWRVITITFPSTDKLVNGDIISSHNLIA